MANEGTIRMKALTNFFQGHSQHTTMADVDTKKMKRKHLKLYSKATFTGYRRGLRNQYEAFALLKLEGTFNKEDAKHYLGKRCVYVYKVSYDTETCYQW